MYINPNVYELCIYMILHVHDTISTVGDTTVLFGSSDASLGHPGSGNWTIRTERVGKGSCP